MILFFPAYVEEDEDEMGSLPLDDSIDGAGAVDTFVLANDDILLLFRDLCCCGCCFFLFAEDTEPPLTELPPPPFLPFLLLLLLPIDASIDVADGKTPLPRPFLPLLPLTTDEDDENFGSALRPSEAKMSSLLVVLLLLLVLLLLTLLPEDFTLLIECLLGYGDAELFFFETGDVGDTFVVAVLRFLFWL